MTKLSQIIISISLIFFTLFLNPLYCFAENTLNITFNEIEFPFEESQYEYNLEVDFEIRKLTPTVTLNNENISFESLNNDKIIVGYNRVVIKVNKANYIFNVTRKSSSIASYKTYNYTGNYQEFIAPKTGKYKIELWGARGGNIGGYHGGYGAYTSGNIDLNENDKLYIYVGGSGSEANIYGGYNGGGNVGTQDQFRFGRSGGGATDVRLVSGTWNNFDSLKSRIMVAAGGGGANYRAEGYGEGNGGAGGGLTGYTGEIKNSNNPYGRGTATGGTQTSGGTFTWNGVEANPEMQGGMFGAGGGLTTKLTQGGGGSGYYGGSSNLHAGAGGGSSFISGHNGCDAIAEESTSGNIIHTGNANHYSGKIFTNTMMIDGKGYSWTDTEGPILAMPNPSGDFYTKGTGHNGAGAARISILNPGEDNNYLENIILSAGEINFNKETNNYQIELDEDVAELEVRALPENMDAAVNGNGIYEINPGTNNIEITVTALDGSINVYTLEITRPISSNPYLKGLLINGEILEDFIEDTLEYNIVIPYNITDVNVEAILANKNQTVTGEGVQILVENKATAKIFVVSEDKNANKLYTLNFTKEKSTILHKITFNDINLELPLEDSKFNYEIDVSKAIHSLEDLTIEPYYYGVNLDVTGNRYLGERNNIIKIVSSLDGIEPSTYTIKVNFKNDIAIETNDYYCNGSSQTFVANSNGFYKIELWGARGGNIYKYLGGNGAYTSGSIKLAKNEALYIYVGCAGSEANMYGGFNGGGHVGSISNQFQFGRSGGGATDIRLVNGAWNDFDSLKSRIMVAAGGGGANYRSQGYGEGNGGSGGGLTGYTGEVTNSTNPYGRGTSGGGTQTSGGKLIWHGVKPRPLITEGSFGYGGGTTDTYSQAGGGGGYYGGSSSQHSGAGGGSSFISGHKGSNAIAESSTVSNITHTKDNVHYSGKKFEDTIMIDGNGYSWSDTKGSLMLMPHPAGGYYNSGVGNNANGFARISTLETLPNDNFLQSLTLLSNGKEIPITFEPWILEYNINLTETETKLDINAIPMDLKAEVTGTGTFDIAPGESTHEINVTAQDGSVRTYTININRTPSSDALPLNIELKRLSKNLCKLNSLYCNYEFNPDTLDYNIFLPYNTREIEFNPILKSKWQTIEYKLDDEVVESNLINLTKETTKFEVKIISEDKEHSTTYVYNLTRDMTGNNNLVSITITNPNVEIPDFSPNTYEYYLTLPKGHDQYDVEVETESANATYEITGNTNLKFGMNDCYITVTAENGDSKMYIIHMYKEYEENVLLDYLKVYNEMNLLEITPTFDNKINAYDLKAPKDVDKIRIDATAIDSKASVTGTGEKNLEPGLNTFEVEVSIGSVTNTYVLNIFKERDNNPNVKNITVVGYELDKEFNKDELEYYVYLKNHETSLDLTVEMESSKATYTINGNTNLTKTINEIIVTGIAEDKTTKVYKIYAVKEISNNNYLANLEYKTTDNFEVIPDFDKETLEYTLDVASDINKIEIKATPEDKNALVTGNGTYYLEIGHNEIIIQVTSEQLETREYKININLPLSDDVTLKEVTNNRGSNVTEITDISLGYKYLINVQNNINSIEITGIPNDPTSRVTGNRNYNIATGINDITLTVKSASGKTKDYIVRIVRDKSDNDDLDFLFVEEGGLDPHFKETTILYDVKVPNNTNTLHIEAITEDKNATYEVVGGTKISDNKYTYDISSFEVDKPGLIEVEVTAEDGVTKKIYTLSVTKEQATTEDLSLIELTTNRGNLTPEFNPDTLNYTLEVENDISDITINAKAVNENLTVLGPGTYDLKIGKNGFAIFVVGENNIQRDYQIVVTRKKSSDATLSSLVIKESILNPQFKSDITTYNLTTSKDHLEFTTIKPTESEAIYEIIGNESFVSGENTVTIRVTAPDGVTTKDYTLTVTKEGSKNNNLASLAVVDYELVPAFHRGVTFYTVEADNNAHNILITAIAEDENATIEGIGLQNIEVGENYFDIIVTSEFGNKKIYTILVTKEASDNNYLSSLVPSAGTLNPEFKKTLNNYELEVESDVKEITFMALPDDSKASVTSINNQKLEYGQNKLEITVTSESGLINVYTINVTRKPLISSYLQSLEVEDYTLNPNFAKENLEYYLDVNNETTSLNLSYVPEDKAATVTITGNELFNVGMNEVHITVTASDNSTTNDYIIYVNRQMSSNNYLNSLMLNKGELNPEFHKETLTYNVDVENNVTEIEVFATTEDENAKITKGLGKHTLNFGPNTIEVKVRSQKGLIRTYTVIVNKQKSSNNKLGNILVKNLSGDVISSTPPFNSDTNNYTYDLIERLEYINISTYLGDEFQTITGDGIKELKPGVNTFDIIVTAQDGSINTYTLTINNPLDTNNYLNSLIPSAGTLDPEFTKETLNYTLNLDNEVNTLSFTVTTESSKATVSGHENKGVPEGTSTREIKVIAEDGSEKIYTITVNKQTASDARLDSLTIIDYPFTFDSDTFVYNLNMSAAKKKLLASEITATPKDSAATVNLMGDLELTPGIINIYTIEVIAKDGYTTETYTLNITTDNPEYTLVTNVYDINRNEKFDYVIGILPSTNILDFKNNFENDNGDLVIYDNKDIVITDDAKLVGTGFTIKLEKNNKVYDELKVIVRGDLNSDGRVNVNDQVRLINYVGKVLKLNDYEMLAADLNFDGRVNVNDQVRIINYVGKVITTNDLNPKNNII